MPNNKYMGAQLAGGISPSGPVEVEDAVHAIDAVFELRPVTRQEIFDFVVSEAPFACI